MMRPIEILALVPGEVTAWVVIGVFCGWSIGWLSKARASHVKVDIAVGLVGSVAGGGIFSLLVRGTYAFWGSTAVSLVSAAGLLVFEDYVLRWISGRRGS